MTSRPYLPRNALLASFEVLTDWPLVFRAGLDPKLTMKLLILGYIDTIR